MTGRTRCPYCGSQIVTEEFKKHKDACALRFAARSRKLEKAKQQRTYNP